MLALAEETLRRGWRISSTMEGPARRRGTDRGGPLPTAPHLSQRQESVGSGGEVGTEGY